MRGASASARLWRAGGLATSVHDMAAFLQIQLWITGVAPARNGRPIISTPTLQLSAAPLVTLSVVPPTTCLSITIDANTDSFSKQSLVGVDHEVNVTRPDLAHRVIGKTWPILPGTS